MSDFSDTLKYAIEHGILLDSCGESERQYWWGLYNDLCGMSVEDALKVQYYHQDGSIDPGKKTNIINFVMQKGADGEYTLYLIPKYAPTTPVTASFSVDGVPNTVTIPAGSTSFNTGIKSTEDPTKPYAEISNASFVADDPSYNYAGKNSVSNGVFKLTIDKDGEIIVEEVKYGTTVAQEYRSGLRMMYSDTTRTEQLRQELIAQEQSLSTTEKMYSTILSHTPLQGLE